MKKNLAVLLCMTVFTAALWGQPKAHAARVPLQSPSGFGAAAGVHFDSQSHQTRITGRVPSEACYSLVLPQEWRSAGAGDELRLEAAQSDAELKIELRSSHDLQGLPQADLVSRDAALLQQDYEGLLGRPAQSVSLTALSSEAARWSATWADPYLPNGPMTIEAFIVPLSEEWVLELSFTDVSTKEEHDSLARSLLGNMKVQRGPGCGTAAAF